MTPATSPLVTAYLADLERALADADPSDRLEIVDAVREHIEVELAELGASPTQAQVAGVLRRLGTADDVAAAWAAGADRPVAPHAPARAAGPSLRPSAHGLTPIPPGEATAAGTSPWLIALVVLVAAIFGVPLVLGLLSLVFIASAPVGAGVLTLLAVAATGTAAVVWRRAARHRRWWFVAFVVGLVVTLAVITLDVRVFAEGDSGSGVVHGGGVVQGGVAPTPSPASAGIPLRMP